MISKDIQYIGVNDHELDLFEGQYIVPGGMEKIMLPAVLLAKARGNLKVGIRE